MTAVSGRKKAIKEYLEKITVSVESTNYPETLDRILALLIKADASVTTYSMTGLTTALIKSLRRKINLHQGRKMRHNSASQRHLAITVKKEGYKMVFPVAY